MTWKLTPFAKTRTPLRGVPWRDLTDAEYTAACELHPGMEERGYFAKAEEPKKARVSRTVAADKTTATIPVKPAPPAEEEETNG